MLDTLGLGPENFAIPETLLRMLVSTAILILAIILARAVTDCIVESVEAVLQGDDRLRPLNAAQKSV